MTPKEMLDRRDRQAAYLAELDKQRHSALASDGAATIRWAVATGVTVNSGGVALLASRDLITVWDQVAMSLLVASIVGMLLSGWAFARSSISEAAAIHTWLVEQHCDGSDLSVPRKTLRDDSVGQDTFASWAGIASLAAFLVGGMLGIWL